jgi:hypothetical protein
MERTIQVFKSHAEAEAADHAFYASLTPEQRMEILFELIRRGSDDPEQRLERVCRVVKRGEG